MQSRKKIVDPASFRDPSGFVYFEGSQPYRQINASYIETYQKLLKSGLYKKLIKLKYLLPHKEVKNKQTKASILIKPEKIPFISYPYEWSFSQFKDAALLTLEIQKIALTYGMTLKDASAYNVQFLNGKPILIDTLSFEIYEDGSPWVAYKQFCQHFLAPLVLMSKRDIRLSSLLRNFIDGIPLDLTSKLLPKSSWLSLPVLTNIHLHSIAQRKYASNVDDALLIAKSKKMPKTTLFVFIEQLLNLVNGLQLPQQFTEWGKYYTFTNYNKISFSDKKRIIGKYIKTIKPKSVWDLGANNGEFSRIASDIKIPTIAFDIDPIAVDLNYQLVKQNNEKHMLPLLCDLTNPSPAIGWANGERKTLNSRGPADLVMALALIHHMAISNNLPFGRIAEYFASLAKYLIIEFVPKSDSKVKKLLSTRKDIFNNYNQESFEKEFGQYYSILNVDQVKSSKRVLYLMRKKS